MGLRGSLNVAPSRSNRRWLFRRGGEEANFVGWGNDDPDNDFGWNASVPVELIGFSIE